MRVAAHLRLADRWVSWIFAWTPEASGAYQMKVRSVNEDGDASPIAAVHTFEVLSNAPHVLRLRRHVGAVGVVVAVVDERADNRRHFLVGEADLADVAHEVLALDDATRSFCRAAIGP